ncbi:hypothetical protein KQ51_01622 [Candidatus Izimaplasma bacterium HR1]|jgi:uncharacterized membrane protein|uniref:putative ABC transporter permease n=1 Tax=Candidatus Izimoplasma sp. HR1 TaxID=1541959 RepID=UPI0004F6B2BE|nr:hypothetical protein KQ51_01622 [Candidatus Izimaplasma bacterium HR1]
MNNNFKNKYYYIFKRYFMYLIAYSVAGFILERIINMIFLGDWYDNSVLIGPYQPLYGFGLLLTIIFFENVYRKIKGIKDIYKEIIFIAVAILATGLVEAITGFGFEYLYGIHLWDYSDTFPCSIQYVCIYPTTIFGILSYLVIKYIHPLISRHIERVSNVLFYTIFVIFITDIIFTLITLAN